MNASSDTHLFGINLFINRNKILIQILENIRINNLFNEAFIIFYYKVNKILKNCAIVNHKVPGHLEPFRFDVSL